MRNRKYNHIEIEKKWQTYWEDHKTFVTTIDHAKPKYYVLDMFPYPSGAGLHVGHVTGYTSTDIISRFMKMKGYNVLHPMGWDSFGLQAEQYAVRTGQHPAVTTEINCNTYRRQLKALGFCYDWSREIATSDESYYKWTQWIFTKLYEKNLAYEAEVLVNFCPHLGTVLANEEVENGHSKDGGYPVERRPLRQWVLKITEYADRLVEDLDLVDWPEHLKKLQINWIGKSHGAKIRFDLEGHKGESIEVFTTRPDTVFGVSAIIISPEHPLAPQIVSREQKDKLEEYMKVLAQKSDMDRTDPNKEKNGLFLGVYVVHPITQKKVPVWVSDYVLMGYGTGAIMSVPAHDERDFQFSKKYALPIYPVIEPSDPDKRGSCLAGEEPWCGDGVMIHSKADGIDLNGKSPEIAAKSVVEYLTKIGKGEEAITYKLRDWLFSRQRYWGEPFPILHYEDGSKRVLSLDELPLAPPRLDDYKPSGDGRSPLAKVKEWVEIIDPKTGKRAWRETNTMPQWAGSCWYYLRFCDPLNDKQAWSKEAENYWMPVDLYVGGVEHAVLHLLYARFWHKVLYDCGLVSTKEPFQKLRNQGLVVAKSYKIPGGEYVSPEEANAHDNLIVQIEKMSKSKLNGVSPDEIIERYGADTLRLYEMFMGPFDKEKLWNVEAVSGCRRFLDKFYALFQSEKLSEEESAQGMRLAHILAHGVEKDIQEMQFNTAIAKMMEFVNHFSPLDHYPKKALEMALLCLAPFAPHIAEELWSQIGHRGSISHHPFPLADQKYLIEDTVTYVVQVNGKVRGRFELPKDQSQDRIVELAQHNEMIAKHIQSPIEKVVFVPNKLLNFVTKQS